MDSVVLVMARVLMVVTMGTLVFALVAWAVRRPGELARAWLPWTATLLLVAGTAAGAFDGAPTWVGATWFLCFPLLSCTYPDGRFVPRWTVVPVTVSVVLSAAFIATDGRIGDQPWWTPFALAQFAFLGAAVYRYRRRLSVGERMQVRWPVLGALIEFSLFGVIIAAGQGSVGGPQPLGEAAAIVAGIPIPVGFAIGLLRPRWIDVDRALHGVTRTILVTAPLAVVFWVGSAIAGIWMTPASAAWIGAIAVGIAAFPVQRLAATAADRLVYRGRIDAVGSLRQLGDRLAAQVEPSAVPFTIVALVRESLSAAAVELHADGLETEQSGSLGAELTDFPIQYNGELIGRLRVSPRAAETSLTARDIDVLTQLCKQAAPALHGARTHAELTRARAQVVLAREEERKRLRRDLHDDLAPTLVGLGLGVAAISELARSAPEGVEPVAAALSRDIQGAIAQTRELVDDLRPSVLDDEGLVAALRRRLSAPAGELPVVSVTAPDGDLRLPAAVELAALRVTQEAVANARRHARARTVAVDLHLDADSLGIVIVDDGSGLPMPYAPGVGLASIRSRAEELGGTASIGRGDRQGTRIAVRLPIREAPIDTQEVTA